MRAAVLPLIALAISSPAAAADIIRSGVIPNGGSFFSGDDLLRGSLSANGYRYTLEVLDGEDTGSLFLGLYHVTYAWGANGPLGPFGEAQYSYTRLPYKLILDVYPNASVLAFCSSTPACSYPYTYNNGSIWGLRDYTPGQRWQLTGEVLSVPEPASWAMMIFGFGAIGGAMRASRTRFRQLSGGTGYAPRP